MTSLIFLDFLESFADKVRAKKPNENVLLFMDSFSAHEAAWREIQEQDINTPLRQRLAYVRVEFLPKNATALYQPMDQGIITNVKVYYRRKWLQFMVLATLNGQDPLKTMTLFHAIQWLLISWNAEVKKETITNCFLKSQILGPLEGPKKKPKDWDESILPVIQEAQDLANKLIQQGQIKELMDISTFLNPDDEEIIDPIDSNEIIDHIADIYSEVREANETEAEERSIEPVSTDQLAKALSIVLQAEEEEGYLDIAFQEGLRRRLDLVNRAKIVALTNALQQTRIESFFRSQN